MITPHLNKTYKLGMQFVWDIIAKKNMFFITIVG